MTALGLDETLFSHEGRWRRQLWSTSIVDVRAGRLLDIVPGRNAYGPCAWLAQRGEVWLEDRLLGFRSGGCPPSAVWHRP